MSGLDSVRQGEISRQLFPQFVRRHLWSQVLVSDATNLLTQ